MKPYIFTERNGIHIIDLQQTAKALEEAYILVRDLVAGGGVVLFVGTKRQAVETIEMEAQRANMPYVTVRWLGGMLTNWQTMRQRISELERLERMREKGEIDLLTKREGLSLTRKIEKLEDRFGGIRDINRLPDMLFIVDVKREDTAVKEANTLGIPILGLVDTNCDPSLIDHVIPSNDDAIRAIKTMVALMADAVEEGMSMRKEETPAKDEKPAKGKGKASAKRGQDLSDEELLGSATLAKVAEAQEAEAVAAAKAEAKALEEAEAKAKEEAEKEPGEDDAEGEEKAEEAKSEKDEVVKEAPIAKAKTEKEEKTEKEDKKPAKEEKAKASDAEEGPSTRKKLSSFEITPKNIELLEGAKISTVNQFLKVLEGGDASILDINGIGPKGLEDMKKLLKDEGYRLP